MSWRETHPPGRFSRTVSAPAPPRALPHRDPSLPAGSARCCGRGWPGEAPGHTDTARHSGVKRSALGRPLRPARLTCGHVRPSQPPGPVQRLQSSYRLPAQRRAPRVRFSARGVPPGSGLVGAGGIQVQVPPCSRGAAELSPKVSSPGTHLRPGVTLSRGWWAGPSIAVLRVHSGPSSLLPRTRPPPASAVCGGLWRGQAGQVLGGRRKSRPALFMRGRPLLASTFGGEGSLGTATWTCHRHPGDRQGPEKQSHSHF